MECVYGLIVKKGINIFFSKKGFLLVGGAQWRAQNVPPYTNALVRPCQTDGSIVLKFCEETQGYRGYKNKDKKYF